MSDQSLIPCRHRRKRVDSAARAMAINNDWGRTRPITCFRILGVPEPFLDPVIPAAFDKARERWVAANWEARTAGDAEMERAINLAWTHLKNWRCAICGGLKKHTRHETCGPACGSKLRVKSMRRVYGDVVLPDTAEAVSGSIFFGKALRRAQLRAVRQALDVNNFSMTRTGRQLGISARSLRYYIAILGGIRQR